MSIIQTPDSKMLLNSLRNSMKFAYVVGNSKTQPHVWATGVRAKSVVHLTNVTVISLKTSKSDPKPKEQQKNSDKLASCQFSYYVLGIGVVIINVSSTSV